MGCNEKNPLVREGTSVGSRALPSLNPSFAKPDDRKSADLLLFLQRYAGYLNYYDGSNTADGDWQPLMKSDVSVVLATIMALNTRQCSDYKKSLYKNIRLGDDGSAKREFKYLFDLIFSLPLIITGQYGLLPAEFEYRKEIGIIINSKMLAPLVNLKTLFDDFMAAGLVDAAAQNDGNAPIPVTPASSFSLSSLGTEWTLPAPVPGLTLPVLPGVQQQVVYIINHNFFNAQVEALLTAVSTSIGKAAALFQSTINNYPFHSPHYALVLAFVKLFEHAQEALNEYTRRHLDFYYKEALQLTNKKAEADSAHLLFELPKPVAKHLLLKDSLFKGGKDPVTGKELLYSLTDDTIVNKAVVAKLQATQLIQGAKEKLAAFPVAASEDGHDSQLTAPDKSWNTFGNRTGAKSATVGFAIASNIFYLNEGTRTVTITVNFPKGTTTYRQLTALPHSGFFSGKLSTEKGWFDVAIQVSGNARGNKLSFSFTLGPADPAIKPYDEKIHKEAMETALPVLKIFLNQDSAFAYPYRSLSKDRMESIQVNVDVSGVRDLVLSNNTGAIDASKPFKPFGEFPAMGASFYIGSKELFQKNLTELSFEFGNNIVHDRNVKYLHNGAWGSGHRMQAGTETLLLAGKVFPPAAPDFSRNEALTPITNEGFIRLALNSNEYSMDHYLDLVKGQIDNTRIKRIDNDPVTYSITSGEMASPPSLTLSAFSIDYKASSTIAFNSSVSDSNSHFYHLTPFGYYPVHFDGANPSKRTGLVPAMPNAGELYIGLDHTEPGEVVNILFQVAEGSSNPLKDSEEVHWYYLAAGNEWTTVESRFIIDRTHNFTRSGIVTLTLPLNISNANTALQKGLYWIKAAVQQHPDAVCKMILVQAGAARVRLVQSEAEGIEFSQVLPAGSISKLVTTDSSIKGITQPFESFNGRKRENDEHFYLRVSERLRHKQRAITVWDYEHIVLEQFPELSKVRCINHAGFYTDATGKEVFCENYPGHVTLITIPDFRNRSGINPLKPYTPIGTIDTIQAYLRTIVSPFVKLHVKVPQFEEIQVEFKVSFHEHLDEAFYRQLLATEIEKFLTPWAYEGNTEISFGGRIVKSSILNFVEERPYVDYLTCFKLHHIIQRNGSNHIHELRDVEEAIPTTARSLLVSYSNEITKGTHIISSPADCNC